MQYSEGNLGRAFVLRIDHGEDLIESLKRFVKAKGVESCMALFIGALREGRAVTGPELPTVPPVPHWEEYRDGWEVFGMATIYPSADGPRLHIHSTIGKGREALLGCVRERASVYLVVEAVLMEFTGLNVRREWDEKTELYLPSLDKKF
jgi:predicted DNA-binding protein with PD1-like motif